MIRPPSLQTGFALCWSGDPALKLPEDPKERERALTLARETGKWPTHDGQQPTVFHFEALTRHEIGWWDGEFRHSAAHRRPLSPIEANDLLVRIALRRVDNFGELKVERSTGAVTMADTSIVEALHTAAPSALGEFADEILSRSRGPRPLS